MIIGYFTERPYRWVPEEDVLRNEAFFAVSNKYFDREKAADDYNYFLDEYCYAEELGFDGLALNEHHGNPFCMGSVMNVEAAILARITKRAKIVLIGNPLPVIKHPLRMAEELATIDLISRGRLVTGWVRGAGQRAVLQQRQPGLQPGDVRGGARLHRPGVDPARPVALRGQALPLPAREPVGAALPEAAPADVDPRRAVARDRPWCAEQPLPVHRARHRARADLRPVGHLRRYSRPSTATRPGRRTSATS